MDRPRRVGDSETGCLQPLENGQQQFLPDQSAFRVIGNHDVGPDLDIQRALAEMSKSSTEAILFNQVVIAQDLLDNLHGPAQLACGDTVFDADRGIEEKAVALGEVFDLAGGKITVSPVSAYGTDLRL